MTNDFAPKKGLSQPEIEALVEAALSEATLDEKVKMMSGHGFFEGFQADERLWGGRPYRAGGEIPRLGVPALWFTDGPRGVARGQSTCFPCTMARGASFDTGLERRIGEAMAMEIRAQGCNLSGAICVNLLRHPAWGRAQETYGEDPVHLGEMGAALGEGLQAHNVIATVKHFAVNSIENCRFKVDVIVGERALHEVYLPHFKRILDGGVKSVMSAYNKLNGEYCGQNRHLLTDILRGEWGFTGFVHSDWVKGVYAPYGASAGLDIENPEPLAWGEKLKGAVESGLIEPQVIDQAGRRILNTLYQFACAEDPLPDYPLSLVASPAHIALAREAAEASMVLLENNGVLPLDAGGTGRIALLGRLAMVANTGDNGSSRVRAPHVITPHEGLSQRIGADKLLSADESDLAAVRAAVAQSDVAIVIAGLTHIEEGEFIPSDINLGQGDAVATEVATAVAKKDRGGDRTYLGLPADQIALIEAAAESGKPIIVVIVAGSAILVEGWRTKAAAILQSFYSGMEGGHALARLLFGDVSPAARLPFTVARDDGDYPHFDKDASSIEYDLWHGYPLFLKEKRQPRYPFGHGLSYSSFNVRALKVRRSGETLHLTAAVTNTGDSAGAHVVMAYAQAPGRAVPRWPRKLIAFEKLHLAPGETAMARMQVPLDVLRYREAGQWHLEPGEYRILIAETAEDQSPLSASVWL